MQPAATADSFQGQGEEREGSQVPGRGLHRGEALDCDEDSPQRVLETVRRSPLHLPKLHSF